MLLNEKEAVARLSSPHNLINRLNSKGNRKNAMDLFCKPKSEEATIGVDIKAARVEQEETEREVMSSATVLSSSTGESANGGVTHPSQNTLSISFNPFQKPPQALSAAPTIDKILEDSDSQIKLGLAHDKALDLLTRSVDALAAKLDDVKADKLPSVVSAASKVVEGIRKERSEASKNSRDREVHYHFYTPQQKKLSEFEVIDVGGAVEANA